MNSTNGITLTAASREWASRPDDQRFWTLADMLRQMEAWRDSACEAVVDLRDLRVEPADGGGLALVGRKGNAAVPTHWAFGQLCRDFAGGCPADWCRALPADLAAANVNHGLRRTVAAAGEDGKACNLLLSQSPGGLVLRSATSDRYGRIWNAGIVERLQALEAGGWRVPPARPARDGQSGTRPATEADVLRFDQGGGGTPIRVGDPVAPAGLYASDHDAFAFMVSDRIIDDGTDGGLARGFYLQNSEVGTGRAMSVTTFLYRSVCGNHLIWGAENVRSLRVRHVGQPDARWQSALEIELRRYAEGSAAADSARVAVARAMLLGETRDATIETVWARLRNDGLSRKLVTAGYDSADHAANWDRTINPRSVWGLVQGLTSHSQSLPYADQRNAIDVAAAKVLALAS
jgi:hypothetical protein